IVFLGCAEFNAGLVVTEKERLKTSFFKIRRITKKRPIGLFFLLIKQIQKDGIDGYGFKD
ncbi:hypothetical protein OFN53_42460, partial [Escherichia coli]|nr:hypothetical protein [Escherichia coli]